MTESKADAMYECELENELVLANSLLDSIERILDGKAVSDFELSFTLVRRVSDLVYMSNQ